MVSALTPNRRLRFGLLFRRHVALALALTAIVCALGTPRVHAQIANWDGDIEVSPSTLTLREGETGTYRLRLANRITADGWWVRLFVAGAVRADGDYEVREDGERVGAIRWTPSVGWEFNRNNWEEGESASRWRDIRITAVEVDDDTDATVEFMHEVWDHETNCPIHKRGKVTVRIIGDDVVLPPPPPPPPPPVLNIGDSVAQEGSAANFQVKLTPSSALPVTVSYATENGAATAGTDYVSASGTLTFSAGATSQTIEVQTSEDDLDEPDETFTVKLSNPNGATVDDESGTGTIRDENPTPSLSISDLAVEEGGEAAFEVELSAPSSQEVTVEYETRDGTARAGSDYDRTSGTLTFDAGARLQTVLVQTSEDDIYELNETFSVVLSSSNGATILDATGAGTINDDEDSPTVSITREAEVEEGEEASFLVSLSEESGLTVTVEYETKDETAVSSSDYVSTAGTLTFNPGTTEQTIRVHTREDSADEPDETFRVELRSPNGATLGHSDGIGTIEDDDESPRVLIGNAPAVREGEAALFQVTLDEASGREITVMYRTVDGSAVAETDYTPASGTLTFQPGTVLQTIAVGTLDDEVSESEESFTVELYDATEAGVSESQGTGTGTIVDNDDMPMVSIDDAAPVDEGASTPASFKVTLSEASGQEVSVSYRTRDGTATAGSDYTSTEGTLTFDAGDMEQTITVSVQDDSTPEDPETFTVELRSPSGATIGNGAATGTISDDDSTDPLPSLSISDVESVAEGGTAEFTVTLTPASTRLVTVSYETKDGTALAGSDYTSVTDTLTFAATETAKTIQVSVLNDQTAEQDETFTVELSNPAGATMSDGSGTATITDDDSAGLPTISIDDAPAVNEPGTAEFRVRLSAPAGNAGVTVDYGTVDGSAEAGSDYSAVMSTLTFAASEIEKTISVAVLQDQIAEGTEDFEVELSNPVRATLLDRTGQGTINANDQGGTLALSIRDAPTVREGEIALFQVRLSAPGNQTVSVAYEAVDGTALSGTDYTPTQGTLNFGAGTTELTIAVPTVEDSTREQTETFTVMLSQATGATLERDTGTGTITDDDSGGGGGVGGGGVDQSSTLSIADATRVVEGNAAEFVVSLSPASGVAVTVSYTTVDGTARVGADYESLTGTLRFDPRETSKTITVQTVDDDTREEGEEFTVELSDPQGATLENDSATGRIIDDDEGELPGLSIRDAPTVDEGGTAEFVVTLSVASEEEVTASYRTLDGTASGGADYETATGMLRFEVGETEQTLSVAVLDDEIAEAEESFTVELSEPQGATLENASATGTILDNDEGEVPGLSIRDAPAVVEGGTSEFVVHLSAASDEAVSLSYATVDGTASGGADYESAAGMLHFEPGVTEQTLSVAVLDDEIAEAEESFTVELSEPQGATLENASATGTILDNDEGEVPGLSIRDAPAVVEGGTSEFVVTLSVASEEEVTASYRTLDGTASGGADYETATGMLRFEVGETEQTLSVAVLDDEIAEAEESFTVELSEPQGATLENASATGTILDNDEGEVPGLSIRDAPAVVEGGTSEFVVHLSAASDEVVSLSYATVDGTASGGADYESATGMLRFEVGETEQTLSVAVLDDEIAEAEESFTVELSDPQGATLENDSATGRIIDDDEGELPGLSIRDAPTVDEGGTAEFVVTLSVASEEEVTASYRTLDGTASGGADYESATGMLRFEVGETEQTLSVAVLDDETKEGEESFTVELSEPQGATLENASATGTILDNDEDEVPGLSIRDAPAVVEGGTSEFVVHLSAASDEVVSLSYATVDGTASGGADYESATGMLHFEPGETEQTLSVAVLDDEIAEAEESFTVELSEPQGATLENASATGTILDNDEGEVPGLSIRDAPAVVEGGTSEFVVHLSAASDEVVSLSYATVDGTASGGADYESATGMLHFEPGETEQTLSVTVLDDETKEGEESFTVELSEPQGATLENASATGTILDNDEDEVPGLSIRDAPAVVEGGTSEFVVHLSAASDEVVSLSYATVDGTASGGADYESATGMLHFEPGETEQTLSVTVLDDETKEGEESFTVELSEPQGATLENASATGTILDNDEGEVPGLSIRDAPAVVEGGTSEFVVHLSAASDEAVSLSYATVDGTASGGADYESATGMLHFEPGETEQTLSVTVLDDETKEGEESFTVELSEPQGATLENASATGTILDNDEDEVPGLSIRDAPAVVEGGTSEFVVHLSAASDEVVSLSYATVDGTASGGADYESATGMLRFEVGETEQTLSVAVLDDEIAEAEESFTVELSDPQGATLENDSATGRIIDDDEGELPGLSIRDAPTVDEGGTAEFVVTLSVASEEEVTASYRTLDGTASGGADYETATGMLRFEVGETEQTLSVAVLDDEIAEAEESFTVELSEPQGATLENASATGTILDNDEDEVPGLSIRDAPAVVEGGTSEFVVHLSAASDEAVSLSYATVDGTASGGADYESATGMLHFEPGETEQTLSVAVLDDETKEGEESFTVELSEPQGATLENASATGTILDNDEDEVPGLSIRDAPAVVEGGTSEFVVHLSAASDEAVSLSYATVDGTASGGADYESATGMLRFEVGETEQTLSVAVLDDETKEGEESFTVELSEPQGATLENASATGTILDNDEDEVPGLSIRDAPAVVEGGTSEFVVHLSAASDEVVSLSYATVDGTASGGADYESATGMLHFEPGETEQTLSVAVLDDEIAEAEESFTVELSEPQGATLENASATGTILDNDEGEVPGLSIRDAPAVVEGGTSEFVVHLSAASDEVVSLSYATVDGTASGGADYESATGMLHFEPGETEQTLSVTVLDDETKEGEESFTVELSEPQGATLENASATGTILDNDEGEVPGLSIRDAPAVVEGGTSEFVVHLSAASDEAVSLSYATVDGTASGGADYESATGMLHFEPGETEQTLSVTVLDDETKEGEESFTVELSEPQGATLENASATGTILDNDEDEVPGLSIRDAPAVVEGGTSEFVVHLSAASDEVVSLSYATVDGTASGGADYESATGMLHFEPGETEQTLSVTVLDDETKEGEESFTVELSEPQGATLENASATGTILDNDEGEVPGLSIRDAPAVVEGGTSEFVVHLSAASDEVVSLSYATVDGTASGGADYESATGMLHFEPGETEQTLSVTVLDDETKEGEESFTVELSEPQGATLENASATGTILDNDEDEVPGLSIRDAPAVVEGGTSEFVVHLSAASDEVVSLSYATVDGTASGGADYESATGMLRFWPGQTEQTIRVSTLEDETREDEEGFSLKLSDPLGATLEDDTGTGTIIDDDEDEQPGLSIADASPVSEGETAEFMVTLSAAIEQEVTMSYRTVDGTAVAGSDYESTAGTLRFDAGVTEQTISVAALDDETAEPEESFTVELSDASGATFEDETGLGTIVDDDEDGEVSGGPAIAIGDATAVEEGGTAEFEVRLNPASDAAASVMFATSDGTAVAGADYESTSGTLRFEAGETVKTVSVAVLDDETAEAEESFTVKLRDVKGATLEDDTGTGTIIDDDEGRLPGLSIRDSSPVTEGDTAVFLVTLSLADEEMVSLSYETVDGTALGASDYESASGTLRFWPGQTNRTIRVPTLDDETREVDESFSVRLGDPQGAVLENDTGTATIVDDDEGKQTGVSIGDAPSVREGEAARFTVNLSAASEQEVSISYRTLDGTAAAGSDYESTSGTLRFAPGDLKKSISVATLQDEAIEDVEEFTVELHNAQGATLEVDTGVGTIVDDDEVDVDDRQPALTIADAAPVAEGDTAEFVVRLSRASDEVVTVSYSTVDGTAVSGSDYTFAAGTLSFRAGESAKTISVAVLVDETLEVRERFAVELRNPVGARLADGSGLGTILGDAEQHLDTVNDVILPEMGRAMAFTPVRCRMDQLFGDAASGATRPAGRLSLSPLSAQSGHGAAAIDAPTSLEVLRDTSFLVPLKKPYAGTEHLAAWGCSDFSALAGDGEDGDIDWDGVVSTVQIGADLWLTPYLLTGLSMAQSFGAFDYRTEDIGAGVANGERDMWMTGLHSYIAWSITPETNLWWTLGHSWGKLESADDLLEGRPGSDATLASAAIGFGTRLAMRDNTTLTLKGEGALALLDVEGAEAVFGSASLDLLRLRLSTEVKHTYALATGGSLIPWGELGLRHDGGHGENGSGIEVGGGLRYRVPEVGWAIEGSGRWLAVDQGALRSDWGLNGLARFNPGASELGPSASLSLAWGESASGVRRLWENGAAAPDPYGVPAGRYEAHFAYGIPALRGRGVLTPYGALSLGDEYGRGYRLGSRLNVGQYATVNLEAERRERPASTAVHSIGLRGAMQF